MFSITYLRELLKLVIKKITLKHVIVFSFLLIIRQCCKNLFFCGIHNIYITIVILCFTGVLVLCLNYKEINNLNSYIFSLIYLPLSLIIFIIMGLTEYILLNYLFSILMGISFVFVLGLDNNIIPDIPPSSNDPGGMQGPSGNHNSNNLGLANNADPDSKNRRSLSNFAYTTTQESIFEPCGRQQKYDKANYAHQLAADFWYAGYEREIFHRFCEAGDKLRNNPRSLNYRDIGVLKLGFVPYRYLLSIDSKQLLHGLAQEGPIENTRARTYSGFKTTNLLGPDARVIIRDMDVIKPVMLNDIIAREKAVEAARAARESK
jgi:hypothetical protein